MSRSSRQPKDHPRKLSLQDYDAIALAYFENQDIRSVMAATGFGVNTVLKYVNKGDPSRKLPPIKERFADFRTGVLARQEKAAEDRILSHMKHAQLISSAMVLQMWDKETNTLANAKHATPKNWADLVRLEVELSGLHEKRTRDAEDGVEVIHADFSDPRQRAAMKAEMRQLLTRSIVAVAKEMLMALDPAGSARLIDRLPPHLRTLIDTPVDDPEPGAGREILARVLPG